MPQPWSQDDGFGRVRNKPVGTTKAGNAKRNSGAVMDIRDTLTRIKTEADGLGWNCPPTPHACPICEIQHLANEALAALGKPDPFRVACEAMLRATGGSEHWNGETHEALKLMEAALKAA